MLMPVLEELRQRAHVTKDDIGFTCSGSTDYLAGVAFSFVMTLDGVGPVAADPGEPRRDGRRLRAVRGVGQAPARRGRLRPRLRLREVVARTDPRGAVPPARPVQRRAAVARRDQPRCAPGPGRPRGGNRRRGGDGRGRHPQPEGRARATRRRNWRGTGASTSTSPRSRSSIRCARSDCPPITDGAAAVVIAADDFARERCERPAWIRGIDHRIDPMALGLRDLTEATSARLAGEQAGVGARWVRHRRAARAVHPPGAAPARRRSASTATSTSTRRGARCAPTRSWRPASSASARRRSGSSTGRRPGRRPRHERTVPAAEPRRRAGGRP